MNKISKALKKSSSKKSQSQNDCKDKRVAEEKSEDDVSNSSKKSTAIDTTAVDATAVDTTAVDTTVVDTTAIDATAIDVVAMDAVAMDTAAIDAAGAASTTTVAKVQNENESNKELDLLQEENSLENLTRFCEYLELVILNANDILNKAYEGDKQKNLRKRLQRCVKELMNLQKEINTISENIKFLKMEIKAVKTNAEEHKVQLKQLKSKERRKKLMLSKEKNRTEIKNENTVVKFKPKARRLNSPASLTSESRQYGETALLPWFGDVTETDWNRPTTPPPQSTVTTEPRTMSVTRFRPITIAKRIRNNRQRRLQQQQQQQQREQVEEKGVTIFLKRIEGGQNKSDSKLISASTSTSTMIMDWSWPD